jgi:hypothetical protein
MSEITDKLVGVPQAVLDDPRVQAQIVRAEGGDSKAAEVLTATPPDLGKYGITLQVNGLMMQARLVRVLSALRKHGAAKMDGETVSMDIPAEYQPFIWTFLLGAPKRLVYTGLDALDKDGLPAIMEIVDDWFESLKVPTDATADIMQAMANSFEQAMKAMKFVPSEGHDEKKVATGSVTSSTS